ncbi:MAG: TatD family hydrolase [Treponema sp.]|nr:TatD family hydrolase [Treponema sp.]
MSCDAHVHPYSLFKLDPGAEAVRRSLGIAAAASAWNREEFMFHRELAAAAEKDGAPPVFLCFAVHPQAPAGLSGRADETGWEETAAGRETQSPPETNGSGIIEDSLDALAEYAAAGELAAVGETGFDLFDENFRQTEARQEQLFAAHLETALRYGLPLVIHVRRAMHKIFPYTPALKKLPAVVFHSWPGSPDEGFSLLRRGVNAFFSFGTTIMLNHKNAIRSCAAFAAERLLLETDAPFQSPRGKSRSSWEDLPAILRAAAAIRASASGRSSSGFTPELERITDSAFYRVFGNAKEK